MLLDLSEGRAVSENLLKAILLISIADIGSYNRLTNRKIKDAIDSTQSFINMVNQGIRVNSPEDLKTAEMNELHWGKMRFHSFTALEEIPQEEEELKSARRELDTLIPAKADQIRFYKSLGEIPIIGLIFNLRREITDPKLRVRLIVWLVTMAEKYKGAFDWIEFSYSRFDKTRKPKEIAFLNDVLQNSSIDEIELKLKIRLDREKRGLWIYLSPADHCPGHVILV